MFQRFHAMKERKESGFTLIELLVVILIIAILAAIAIPVFLNQRKKGWISQSQSALKNAALALETCGTETNGNYTDAKCTTTSNIDPVKLASFGYSPITNVTLSGTTTATSYCIIATHALLAGPPADPWHVSTYSSAKGQPTEADTCA